jgi:hypothetical protein
MFLSQYILTEYSQYVRLCELFCLFLDCWTRDVQIQKQNFQRSLKQPRFQTTFKRNRPPNIVPNINFRYLDRRITRSEFAKRISNIEKGYLQRVVLDWFFDTVKIIYFTGFVNCGLGTRASGSRPQSL